MKKLNNISSGNIVFSEIFDSAMASVESNIDYFLIDTIDDYVLGFVEDVVWFSLKISQEGVLDHETDM